MRKLPFCLQDVIGGASPNHYDNAGEEEQPPRSDASDREKHLEFAVPRLRSQAQWEAQIQQSIGGRLQSEEANLPEAPRNTRWITGGGMPPRLLDTQSPSEPSPAREDSPERHALWCPISKTCLWRRDARPRDASGIGGGRCHHGRSRPGDEEAANRISKARGGQPGIASIRWHFCRHH